MRTTWRSLGAATGRLALASAVLLTNPLLAQNFPANAPGQQANAKTGVSGRVADKAGKPIANATVHLVGNNGQSTKTDAEGTYHFPITRAGEYRIGAEAQGFLPVEYWNRDGVLLLSPQGHATRDIVLERGATIVVGITDSAGEPLKGVRVSADSSTRDYRGGARQVLTDDSGSAYLIVIPSKKPYIVTAVRDQLAPAHETVTADSVDNPVDVTLSMQPGETIKGVALCNDGKPAAGWDLYAQPEWWVSPYLPEMARIDAQGNFTLKDLGPGKHALKLMMRMPNGAGTSKELPITIDVPIAQQPLRVELPLPSPASLVKVTGKVRVTGGRPDHIQVQANNLSAGGDGTQYTQVGFPGVSPRVDKNAVFEGTYTFDGLAPGVYQITLYSQDTEHQTLGQVKIPGDIPLVEMKMLGRPHLAGTVVDAAGKPVTSFSLRTRKTQHLGGAYSSDEARWTQISHPEGKFDMEMRSPGVYQAQILAPGHAVTWSAEARLADGDAKSDLKVQLGAGGTLAGTITGPAGEPVAGAKVIPFSTASSPRPALDRFANDKGSVLTDASGRFVLEHLPAGEEKLKVVHTAFAPRILRGLKVADGQTTDIGSAALALGGTVEGIVYDNQGQPAPEVQIEFRDSEGYYGGEDESAGQLATTTTDDEGRFRVEHLPDLPVYARLINAWERVGTTRLIIRPMDGKTIHVVFGGTKPITGRLLNATGPMTNMRVTLGGRQAYSSALSVTGKTDAQGRFTLYGVPPGNYTLHAMADAANPNYLPVRKVQVTADTSDLGDLQPEGSDVVIAVQADAPETLSAIDTVYIRAADRDTYVSNTLPDADKPGQWRARGIAPGKYRVVTATRSAGAVYAAPLECTPNTGEQTVTLRIPKPSATLSVTLPSPTSAPVYAVQNGILTNEDQSVMVYLTPQGQASRTLKLPPGTYRVLDYATWQPREDIPAITLKDGEETSAEIALVTPQRAAARVAAVHVWTANGTLVSDLRPRITDAAGAEIAPARYFDASTHSAYVLQPGHYKAILERPGSEPVTKGFEVTAADGTVMVELFLP